MLKVVISEFMDEAAIRAELAGFETLYDPTLVDRPDALRAAYVDFLDARLATRQWLPEVAR